MIYVESNGFRISALMQTGALLQRVSGVDKPPIRTSDGEFSGRDGGWVSSQFYSKRRITIAGKLYSNDCDSLFTLRCQLDAAFPIRTEVPLVFGLQNSTTRYASGYVTDLRCDWQVGDGNRDADFEVDIACPDPYFYEVTPDDPDSAGWIEQEIYKIVGGGYPTPYELPVEWEPSSSPTIVTNTSGMPIFAQIVLDGTFTMPRVTNGVTGQYVQADLNTSNSDELKIDLGFRTATLNGTSIISSLDSGSSWWALMPGDNPISLTTSSGGDDTVGIIRYRIPYVTLYSC